MTQEERFVLIAYKFAIEIGDPEALLPVEEIGKRMALTLKTAKNIAKTLIRANFLRKKSEEEVALTDRGIELAEDLQGP